MTRTRRSSLRGHRSASGANGGPLHSAYDGCMPKPSAQLVLDWLQGLGFTEPEMGTTAWTRQFAGSAELVSVDTESERIDYGPSVTVHRQTTLNLEEEENLVVLDCVVSLLEAGYQPGMIELERPFKLGHRAGGYLDVLVRQGERTYLMIECKTHGPEFDRALAKLTTRADSQLMTYLQQDRAVEHAILYSSRVSGRRKIQRSYAGFACTNLLGDNTTEIFAGWDKQTYSTGLFEAEPYAVKETALRVRDLRDLNNEDGQALFNSFKEILRRHAVSDLPNAFNKLFNLFICKIIDEDKADERQRTEFQWGSSEEPALVLERLSTLYERGMREYLHLDVVDSNSLVADVVKNLDSRHRDGVVRLVAELRQYSNADFAFIDVFDKHSYDQNAAIVRDMVRLLQSRRLRYTQKHGFMGMFFERLLNTSMKQETGQFFTPPPIAQFINEALPIEALVAEKIKNRDPKFLPYAIDYAAGSGHFLTEYMDRVDKVLGSVPSDSLGSRDQRRNAQTWRSDYTWAGEFVYGVELDHRLAKTAKVSTFLHGDGDANVIRANGLGSFKHDLDYLSTGGRLHADRDDRDNPAFDVVVGNPPYSVSGFARQLPHGAESFQLWPFLGERSDDIESLFIERTKHLLADGGVAGLVLPASLLNNTGMETHARALLLKYFDLVALVSLGGRVFIATNIPCVLVFVRRRSNASVARIESVVDLFLKDGTTQPVRGVHDAFERYAAQFHGTHPAKLRSAVRRVVGTGVPTIDAYEWHEQNRSSRGKATRGGDGNPTDGLRAYVERSERERMTAFFSTLDDKTLVVTSPQPKRAQEEFLGYAFSERRRHEGIRFISGTGTIETPLFDPNDPDNPKKISTLIKRLFVTDEVEVPAELEAWTEVHATSDLLGLTEPDFVWRLQTQPQDQTYAFRGPTERLSSLCSMRIGSTPSRERPDHFRGSKPWVKIGDMDAGSYPGSSPVITSTSESITADASSKMTLVPEGTLLMSFKLTIGNTAIAGVDLFTNEAIVALEVLSAPSTTAPWIDRDYLDAILRRVGPRLLGLAHLGSKKIGRTLNLARLRGLDIPVGDLAFRERIKEIDSDQNLTDALKAKAIEDLIWETKRLG